MGQTWQRLLFAHWRVPHGALRPHVPASLEVEQWDGSAWLGMTPFRVAGLRLRGMPPLPSLSSFYELNCRTYVRRGDRPGIWFFSLDASSRLAVEAARRSYRLPYRHAHIDARGSTFSARRRDGIGSFDATYHPVGTAAPAEPDTLEHFLVERYVLYAADGDRLYQGRVHHEAYPLQGATVAGLSQDLVAAAGLPTPKGEPLAHYASEVDVEIFPLRRVR